MLKTVEPVSITDSPAKITGEHRKIREKPPLCLIDKNLLPDTMDLY
ncbi:MAG: hypothetical protein LBQ54_06700 [Planctomycetaceae bacterium]|nr:hypothetical protein [Planctomycetaceae bacterium]